MKIFDGFEYTEVSSSRVMTKIKMICEDRETVRPQFKEHLDDLGVEYVEEPRSPDSSWGHIEFDVDDQKYRVFFKNQKQDACTAYFEGAQCIYLAVAQDNPDSDLSLDAVKQHYAEGSYDIDRHANLCLTKLPISWADSSAAIARHLLSKLKPQKYTFHRASRATKILDETFYRLNRGAFTHVDKWNPYDIAVFTPQQLATLHDDVAVIKTLAEYNDWLRERLEDNTIVLVSLKKVKGKPTIYSINTPQYWEKEHESAIFVQTKISTGKSNFTSSLNCDLEFDKYGKRFTACFRPSSPGSAVNCELKQVGCDTQDGKINLQTAADCLHEQGQPFDVTDTKWHNQQARRRSKILTDRIWDRAEELTIFTPGIEREQYDVFVQKVDPAWIYSMDIGTQYMLCVENLEPDQQNALCDSLYKNGAAQRSDCGPYLKIMQTI